MFEVRFLVELEDADIEYASDETIDMAKSLSAYIQKHLLHLFHYIDAGTDWFAGFVKLPDCYREIFKEKLEDIFLEWTDEHGHATTYSIEDMDKEGRLCSYNDCVCEGCKFTYDDKSPCRIGCTEA